ncbi:histidine kinase [Nonomuraea sp. NPDC050536]|uniref:histidine kinase n=1 Tax=Nonomuraea sp. NPDC050536 TaxID=3364366 RepID=UPI0037C92537
MRFGFGVVAGAVLAFWAYRVAVSWGIGYSVFGAAAGALVCALALVGRRWAVAAGLAVAVAAVAVSRVLELPAEPGPGMALGLAVLVGFAVWRFPALSACLVAGGGLAVVALTLADRPPVLLLNAAGWSAAVVVGTCPRVAGLRGRVVAARIRREERLRLARELHDMVAHHVGGIVLQAQASQVLARRSARVGGALEEIETAGADALAATHRLVGRLRDAADPPRPAVPDPGDRT